MLNQSHIRGLLASYDFSEGTGTTLTDKSGNSNNATIVGGTWTTDRFGRANRAVLLDGTDDYIDCGLANYQGDLSVVMSCKIVTFADADILIEKGMRSSTQYPPSFRQMIRTASNGLNTQNYYASGLTTAPSNYTSAFTENIYQMFYLGFQNANASNHGSNGRQLQSLTPLVNTAWTTGYSILIGRYETVATYSNIVVDRVMLFNRFLTGHELSKLANRLKIGDMNK